MRSLVRRRLALGGSWVTGTCRLAASKTQQGQTGVWHYVRTRGPTRLDRFLVGLFLCLACSHRHFDFDSLCSSHVPDFALEPQPRSRCRVLIPPGYHQSVTLVTSPFVSPE